MNARCYYASVESGSNAIYVYGPFPTAQAAHEWIAWHAPGYEYWVTRQDHAYSGAAPKLLAQGPRE